MRSPAIWWYLHPVLSLNNEPDLLEDVVRLLLGNADPLGRGDLEALGHQEVGHLPRPRGLKHLPVVTVNIWWPLSAQTWVRGQSAWTWGWQPGYTAACTRSASCSWSWLWLSDDDTWPDLLTGLTRQPVVTEQPAQLGDPRTGLAPHLPHPGGQVSVGSDVARALTRCSAHDGDNVKVTSMLAPWAVRPPSTRSSPISSAISSSLPKPFWKEMNTVLCENIYHLLLLTPDLLHLCEHVPGAHDGLLGVGRLALHKHDVHSRLRLRVRGGSHLKR